jgi:hypothetical protein
MRAQIKKSTNHTQSRNNKNLGNRYLGCEHWSGINLYNVKSVSVTRKSNLSELGMILLVPKLSLLPTRVRLGKEQAKSATLAKSNLWSWESWEGRGDRKRSLLKTKTYEHVFHHFHHQNFDRYFLKVCPSLEGRGTKTCLWLKYPHLLINIL